jgi:hypothetical protein
MGYQDDEARTLRHREKSMREKVGRLAHEYVEANMSIVLVTIQETTYPVTAQVFYACRVVNVTGDEAEGASVTLGVAGTKIVYAANCGSGIPPLGTEVVASLVDGRWVFSYVA